MTFMTLARQYANGKWRLVLAGLLSLTLAACSTGGLFRDTRNQEPPDIGGGGRKVALLLPLSASGELQRIASAMKQAAEMALVDTGGSGITLITKDSRGTSVGAQAAAQAAVDEGAELILGPLLAVEVDAVKSITQPRGINVIAFSSASSVAGGGVYLMSFLPEEEVANIIRYAADQKIRSLAVLYPKTQYGANVQQAVERAATANGIKIIKSEAYARDQISGAPTQAVAEVVNSGRAEALLLPEGGAQLSALSSALAQSGVTPEKVKVLGTGLWDNTETLSVPIAQGGHYAGVTPDAVRAFDNRYQSSYRSKPPRIASLAYDAVSLAAGLAKRSDFSDAAITASEGFQGQNGLFRFRKNGLIERGLAILEVAASGTNVAAEAPRRFGAGF
ncbi:penicillin-binding protein activator [soil metagenome]